MQKSWNSKHLSTFKQTVDQNRYGLPAPTLQHTPVSKPKCITYIMQDNNCVYEWMRITTWIWTYKHDIALTTILR